VRLTFSAAVAQARGCWALVRSTLTSQFSVLWVSDQTVFGFERFVGQQQMMAVAEAAQVMTALGVALPVCQVQRS
jgi:hypothetical protein